MQKTIVLLSFVLLSLSGFSQNLSKADFLEDLEYFKNTLPVKHTNLFAKITKATFEQKVDQVAMRSNGFDQNRFITELFKLVKHIDDEHTFIEVDFKKVLPIQFGIFEEGIFVIGIASANASVLNYKLESINGHPIPEAITRFKELIQAKNNSYFNDRLLQNLNNPVLLNGLELIASDSLATFTLSDSNGKMHDVKLTAVPGKDASKLQLSRSGNDLLSHKNQSNYWYNYNPTSKNLYFNYAKCQEQEGHPFEKFNQELFSLIATKKPNKIIVDLRYNGGGNSAILEPFITQLSKSYLNSKGKLFVLIGKQTFSSALMNAVELKRNTHSILIGEPSSGNINHYGEVRGFRLPKSGIVVAYSTKYWEIWKGKIGPLKPDVDVKYSIKNYIKGKDEALMQVR